MSDGGPAFPHVWTAKGGPDDGAQWIFPGMSLRDYFAAQALTGLCGNDHILAAMARSTDKSAVCARANAIMAYEIADAMLKARAP